MKNSMICRNLACAAMLSLVLSGPAAAANGAMVVERPAATQRQTKWKKAWAWSAAALMASVAADTASSMGRTEMNPLLRGSAGQFNARSAALKFSIAGALLGSQYLLVKKHPEQAAWAATGNFAAAGLTSGIAVRNFRLPK
ncbi:hypothetical protein [Paludibaculum fermentans]|uniref:hypothetical protein n=1 Tax=Paludibaculum fermentans TaxID=1473598 RepID=UPI003EB9DEE8